MGVLILVLLGGFLLWNWEDLERYFKKKKTEIPDETPVVIEGNAYEQIATFAKLCARWTGGYMSYASIWTDGCTIWLNCRAAGIAKHIPDNCTIIRACGRDEIEYRADVRSFNHKDTEELMGAFIHNYPRAYHNATRWSDIGEVYIEIRVSHT